MNTPTPHLLPIQFSIPYHGISEVLSPQDDRSIPYRMLFYLIFRHHEVYFRDVKEVPRPLTIAYLRERGIEHVGSASPPNPPLQIDALNMYPKPSSPFSPTQTA